jgi:hypothetical protein
MLTRSRKLAGLFALTGILSALSIQAADIELTAADKVVADTSKPGFIWNVHQNPALTANDNTRPLLQLAGLLGQNFADPSAQGPAIAPGTPGANNQLPVRFEVATAINFDEAAGSSGEIVPDDQTPGIPGTSDTAPTDGIAGEIITYLDLPAGKHTFIVNSDDGFRTTVGLNFNDFFLAKVAGEFVGGRGFADTAYTVVVQEAGVYGFRTVWEEGDGGSNIEWKYQKPDGTRVLLNDKANGGFSAYRATTSVLPAYVKVVTPGPGTTSLTQPQTIEAVLADGGTQIIDAGSVKLKLNGVDAAVIATKTAGETKVVHTVAGNLQAGTEYTAELTYSDSSGSRTVTWKFTTGPFSATAAVFVIEAEDFDYDGGKYNPQKGTADLDVDVMPYLGGAYAGLAAVEGVDYNNDDANDGSVYREELDENGENEVSMYASNGGAPGNGKGGMIPINSSDRVTYTTTANYIIGWAGTPDWCNYTRNFPDNKIGGWWKVFVSLSYGGDGDGQLAGSLDVVTAGAGTTDQTLERAGSFSAPGSGGWGANNLVPMKNASGGDALVKLVGTKTVRYNITSGDYNFLIFAPAAPPPPFVESAPQDSSKRSEVVLDWVLKDTDTKVNSSTIKVFLDGNDATSKATSTKTATGATIHVDLTGTQFTAGEHPWKLTFSDDSTPAQNATAQGNFVVNPYPTPGVFVIEAEDFNYSTDGVTGGKTNPQKGTADLDVDVMPYLGGAYDGLSAVEGVDYNNNDGEDSLAYRTELDEAGGNEVNITLSNGNRYSTDRGVFELTSNYRIGWVESGSWQDYTRTFPQGSFNVWAALSYDGRANGQLNGSLDLVTSDSTKPNQTTQPLGSFSAPGSGGWGRNELVPMKDSSGAVAAIPMGGLQTVRFNLGSGDFDYLLFVPQAVVDGKPKFSKITISGSNLVIEWSGGGTLVASDVVIGPYTPVTGNPPSPATIPISGAARFFGIR